MKPSDILKDAKAKIEKPENWIQGNYYANSDGQFVGTWSEADCFCSLGALRAANKIENDFSLRGVDYLEEAMESEIDAFNDTHKHAEVLAAFDKAIKTATRDEQLTEELGEILAI